MSCSTGEGEPWHNQVLLHDYDQSQILDAVKRTYLNFCSCCGEGRRRKVSNLAGCFSFSCWRWISRLWRKQLRGLLGGFSAPPFFTLWTHARQSIKQKQRLVNFENTGRLSFILLWMLPFSVNVGYPWWLQPLFCQTSNRAGYFCTHHKFTVGSPH